MSTINMSRRVFIGAAVYFVATPVLASVFNTASELLVFEQKGQFFTASEMTVLTDMAEIMIPKTDTPGATDAQVSNVLDGLMLTWAGVKTKRQFQFFIAQVEKIVKESFHSSYEKVSKIEREELIISIDRQAFPDKTTELSKSYRKLKEMIFHIYYTSEQANPYFMLAPGTYRGDISKGQRDQFNARGRVS